MTRNYSVVGKTYMGEEVEFEGCRACTCPLWQEEACGHWVVTHEDDCPLNGIETVRSCTGPWLGSAAGLNSAQELATWPVSFGVVHTDRSIY